MNIKFQSTKVFTDEERAILENFVRALDLACDDAFCNKCAFNNFCERYHDGPVGVMKQILTYY